MECGRILPPLVGKTRHHIKDSVDLVKKLKDIVIPPNYSLCSFDLKEMFTNMDQERTLDLVQELLEGNRDLANAPPFE